MKLWILEQMGKEPIYIPSASAQLVDASLKRGDKFIFFPGHRIPVHQITNFEETSREDVEGKRLLQAGIDAFKGEVKVITDKDGYHSVAAVKIKKEVSQREFASYYAKHPSYETTAGDGSWVAFWVAKDLGVPEGCMLA